MSFTAFRPHNLHPADYKFNYSVDGVNFTNLGGTVSGDILSTNVAGGFTGSLIGLYATGANDAKP